MENQKLIKRRKKEAKKLQDLIIEKLRTVQMLVSLRILNNDNVDFQMSSILQGASLYIENDINLKNEYRQVRLIAFDFHSHENNSICEFYKEQLNKVEYWISIL